MIITISDMWKNQQKMLDNDNQIKLSSLIGLLDTVNVHDIVGRSRSRAVEEMTLVLVGQVVPLGRCVPPEFLQQHEVLSLRLYSLRHLHFAPEKHNYLAVPHLLFMHWVLKSNESESKSEYVLLQITKS